MDKHQQADPLHRLLLAYGFRADGEAGCYLHTTATDGAAPMRAYLAFATDSVLLTYHKARVLFSAKGVAVGQLRSELAKLGLSPVRHAE